MLGWMTEFYNFLSGKGTGFIASPEVHEVDPAVYRHAVGVLAKIQSKQTFEADTAEKRGVAMTAMVQHAQSSLCIYVPKDGASVLDDMPDEFFTALTTFVDNGKNLCMIADPAAEPDAHVAERFSAFTGRPNVAFKAASDDFAADARNKTNYSGTFAVADSTAVIFPAMSSKQSLAHLVSFNQAKTAKALVAMTENLAPIAPAGNPFFAPVSCP